MASFKELPHDLLAEKSFLGCLLIDGQSFDEVTDLAISKEDFFNVHYGIIFDAILELNNTHSPIDFITVCSKLTQSGHLEFIGQDDIKGRNFILSLVEDQASSANVYHYGKIVKDKSTIRKIIRMANKISEKGMTLSGELKDFLMEVEGSLFKITQEVRSGGMQKLSSLLKTNLATIYDRSKKPGELLGLSTGFGQLDGRLLGLQAGQLIIVAARPGMGKTAFALNLATNVARTQLPVAVFSLEMLGSELSMRLIASEAKIDSKKLRTKDLKIHEMKSLGPAFQRMASWPLFINDSGTLTVTDVQSECRKIKAQSGLGLVIIDYVQLMKPHTKSPSREHQISEISRGLKQLAKELECPVIALSQLNRGVESRPDKRPMVSDLRESGSLEQDADVVLLIYREDFYFAEKSQEKDVAELIVGKNRAGETGTAKLKWTGSTTTFSNLTQEDVPMPDGPPPSIQYSSSLSMENKRNNNDDGNDGMGEKDYDDNFFN